MEACVGAHSDHARGWRYLLYRGQISVQIKATPQRVFDYVSDLSRHPEWAAQKVEMTVHGDPRRPGTTFDAFTYYGVKEVCKGKVLAVEAPRVYSFEADTSTSGRNIWTFEITPDGNGTRVNYGFERQEASFLFKLVQPLMYPIIGRRMLVQGLNNIKSRIEAE